MASRDLEGQFAEAEWRVSSDGARGTSTCHRLRLDRQRLARPLSPRQDWASGGLLIGCDLDVIFDRGNALNRAGNQNGLIHRIFARSRTTQHNHAVFSVSTLMCTKVDSFFSANSALTWVVITESLTNTVADELSESAASLVIGSTNAAATKQVIAIFMFIVSPIPFALTVGRSKAITSMRGERNAVCTVKRLCQRSLESIRLCIQSSRAIAHRLGLRQPSIGPLMSRIAGMPEWTVCAVPYLQTRRGNADFGKAPGTPDSDFHCSSTASLPIANSGAPSASARSRSWASRRNV